MPSEGLRARRRDEMGVGKEAELRPKRNGPRLKILHAWKGVVPPRRDETLHSVHTADDKKAPHLA